MTIPCMSSSSRCICVCVYRCLFSQTHIFHSSRQVAIFICHLLAYGGYIGVQRDTVRKIHRYITICRYIFTHSESCALHEPAECEDI